ncbi:MAG: riboflavin biosynthesis protein [Chitinophagales bacterium]|nr:MAG: riboflavin biosynthesis protein [Chitinophagales bacterium]
MRLFRSLDNLPEFRNGVLTIGTFDGVHCGHQEIIRRLNQIAADINGENIIISFHPHPRMVLHRDEQELKLLTTLDEKISLLSRLGIDNLIIIPFSESFSKISAESYVRDFIWGKIRPRVVVIGYNHRFGNNRSGDIHLLRKMSKALGFQVEEIAAQTVENISVSSTKIRKALIQGDIETANILLGRYYSLSGKVIRGAQLGKKLGFPTANIMVKDTTKLIPANGVYAVKTLVDEQIYGGMLNIGFRPTFNGQHQTIEVHIFEFKSEVYGAEITVEFVAPIRQEVKFNSVEELREQLKRDKLTSLKILESTKTT